MVYNKSKAKGTRAETAVVALLKEATGLNWKRTPLSGALHEDHGLKSDVYIPNEHNYYACEVKHYKDCHLTSKVLTDKNPQLLEWWKQTIRQAEQTDKAPILIFRHDRSKWFVMMPFTDVDSHCKCLVLFPEDVIILEFSEWEKYILPEIEWIK